MCRFATKKLWFPMFFFVFPQNKMSKLETLLQDVENLSANKKLRRALPFTYSEHLNGQLFTVPCCYNFS